MASPHTKKKDTSIVTRPQRNKSAEPATILKIQEAAKWLSEGKSRATIIQMLMDKYGIAADTAKDYYADGVRFLMPKDEDKYRKQLIMANAMRLETIYERAMDEGDYKNAKDAIAEMNKMFGLTGSGVQVAVNNDPQTNSQQVFIKFDN